MAYKIGQKTWSSFKNIITQRNLYIYEIKDTPSGYLLLANDSSIIIECIIDKTDTVNVTDYETNYQNDITKCSSGGYYEGS